MPYYALLLGPNALSLHTQLHVNASPGSLLERPVKMIHLLCFALCRHKVGLI